MLRVSVLMENTALPDCGLATEKALSLLLEYNGKKILFDTGMSGAFLQNADKLQIQADAGLVVLSHGHYDHGNGFPFYCDTADSLDVYMGENYFRDRYAVEPDHMRYNGVSFSADYLKDPRLRIHTVTENITELLPGAWIIKNFDRTSPYEKPPKRLRLKQPDGTYTDDSFDDEICLVFETKQGLVMIVGCSHPGIVNMMQTVTARFPGKRIHSLIGGAHFIDAGKEQIEYALNYIYDIGITDLGLCHCTGDISSYVDEARVNYIRYRAGTVTEIE